MCLDQSGEIPANCDQRRCKPNDQDNNNTNPDYLDLENDDLLVIPILGLIGGFIAFIIHRYKDRLLCIILDRIFDGIGGGGLNSSTAETDITSADKTYVKQRLAAE